MGAGRGQHLGVMTGLGGLFAFKGPGRAVWEVAWAPRRPGPQVVATVRRARVGLPSEPGQ